MVLVSGFTTSTPFSTPAANCAGMEGDTWSISVAPALKAAGYQVFTAPEGPNSDGSAPGNAPSPCVGPGQQAPPPDVTVNTGGDVDDNGQFLGQFLAFLNQDFGVTDVQLVGHSDGGIWSRSAINQPANYPGVTITSLTTLGTPHEGRSSPTWPSASAAGTARRPTTRSSSTCAKACRTSRASSRRCSARPR